MLIVLSSRLQSWRLSHCILFWNIPLGKHVSKQNQRRTEVARKWKNGRKIRENEKEEERRKMKKKERIKEDKIAENRKNIRKFC